MYNRWVTKTSFMPSKNKTYKSRALYNNYHNKTRHCRSRLRLQRIRLTQHLEVIVTWNKQITILLERNNLNN